MARVLLLTVDLDLPNAPISGGVLRVRQLTRQLTALGHEVLVSMPLDRLADHGADADQVALAHPEGQPQVAVEQLAPDVILCEQWHLAAALGPHPAPLWLDLHGSLLGENAFRQAGGGEAPARYDQEVRAKLRAFGNADVITCAGHRQRLYFRGWRAIAGRSFDDWEVLHLPLALEPRFPAPGTRQPAGGGLRLVYAGNLWPWIDLHSWLPAFFDVVAAQPGVTVDFFVDDPLRQRDGSSVIAAAGAGDSWRQLVDEERVTVAGRLAHPEFVARSSSYDAAVDLFSWNSERELALTTRTLEYLSLGLPVIYPAHAELGESIAGIEPRWVVRDLDRAAIADALASLVADGRDEASELARIRAVLERREHEAATRCGHVMERLAGAPAPAGGREPGERRLVSLANTLLHGCLADSARSAALQTERAEHAEQAVERLTTAQHGWQERERELAAALDERHRQVAELTASVAALEGELGGARREVERLHAAAVARAERQSREISALDQRLGELAAASERATATLVSDRAAAEQRLTAEIERLRRDQLAQQTGARLATVRPALARRGLGRRWRLWRLFLDHLATRLYLAGWQRLRGRRIFPGM